MISKLIKPVLCILLGLSFICLTDKFLEGVNAQVQAARSEGFAIGYYKGRSVPQSVGEAQKILKELGYYEGQVDYKWGEQTEKAYCDYCAVECFKRMGEEGSQ